MNNYRRTKTTVSMIHYHFVFCPRYRRKLFDDDTFEQRFKEIVRDVCEELDIRLIAIACDRDHTHLFLSALPSLSPSDIMARIKGVSSKRLREEFPHLTHLTSLWTRSFFVSTAGNVSSETIKRYVEEQKTRR
ncbi:MULTISPECIES: IS200/IS605 family transposase [Exiguobacterium]|uniref:IS200/IS605 family transposase n=1 Tax=Exiguobacterium TaxID=33986 RepID=UPI0009F691DB|nr:MULTISPECIES: IS200/IS605 family transposase [Exiguobacterium]TCI39369.1 IS200/IS605 family transposase [Exiguobacterium sp. SH4S7]TCI64910.1 IS200/IS605 family transposase [Exiguobacterium sp. SH3S1]TCI73350.1 IS200/IS605 family transposase [Exiguobacterium sp. SH0S7]TCI80906.1 IS200/IS605 family transposase [Exiguobacterium sp. SH0S1]